MNSEINTADWSVFSRNYYDIAKTAMFILLGTLAIIVFGDIKGAEPALAIVIISSGLYGILGGDDALRNLEGLRTDINGEENSSNYARSLKSSTFMLFRVTQALAFVALVSTQLKAMF
jgi:hypothetical protein